MDVYNFRKLSEKLIIYDISSNKKRLKISKLLSGYGVRVQKSAFEISITDTDLNQLIKTIPAYMEKDDSIRIYDNDKLVKAWGKHCTKIEKDSIVFV